MQTWQIVFALVFAVLVAVLFFIAYRQHKKRGTIFTNTWLWASKEQREKMSEGKKAAEYVLARNVFFVLGCIFVLIAVGVLTLLLEVFLSIAGVLGLILVVYAVVQSIRSGEWK